MKKSGIYIITNKVNGKVYIGSAVDLSTRWTLHRWELRHHKHNNRYLQNAVNKSGIENFEFKILEECPKEKLIEREQYYLDLYKSYEEDKGYNICKIAYSTLGVRCSEEKKKKISLKNKGKIRDPKIVALVALKNTGRKCSVATKEKIRLKVLGNKSNLGKKLTKEHCEKISSANLGRKHSEVTKQKISLGNIGNKNSLGVKRSKEYKDAVSKRMIGNIPWNKGLTKETDKRIKVISEKVKISRLGKCAGKQNPFFGKHHTQETKEYYSKLFKGKKQTKEQIEKAILGRKKKYQKG